MINKINKLTESEFVKVFANIFEKAKWIAEELYNHRPFNNFSYYLLFWQARLAEPLPVVFTVSVFLEG